MGSGAWKGEQTGKFVSAEVAWPAEGKDGSRVVFGAIESHKRLGATWPRS